MARVLTRRGTGYLLITGGLAGATLVRPHVALLAVVAFGVAFAVGRRTDSRGAITPASVGKVVGVVAVLLLGAALAGRTVDFLGLDDLSGSSVSSALESTSDRTSEGGSVYEPPNPESPVGYVSAVATTLFRPFPTEANGSEQLLTAAEGVLLAVLLLASWRRLTSIPRRLRREPYVTLAVAYLLMFVYVFSAMSNFGILARQRTQLLPFVFVLLSASKGARPDAPEGARASAAGA